MKKKLHFIPLALGLLVVYFSACNSSGSAGPAFDLTGYDSENMGNGISYVSKTNAEGKLVEEGYLYNGVKNGAWLTYDETGVKITNIQSFINGAVNGSIFELKDNRIDKQTSYANGTLHGPSATFKFGRPQTVIPYKNGQIDGVFLEYRENKDDLVKEIHYKDGKKHGKLRYFDEEGNVTVEYEYKNDQKVEGGMVN